jgi:hypothetical protein
MVQMPTERPLLSIIIPAKNDGFMQNFSFRLETTLNYLAASLEKTARLHQVEIVVGDWGSENPLHSILSLTPQARQITHFMIVPPSYAIALQGEAEFPIVMVQNALIRRSLGTFVMQTDSDVLFTVPFIERLFQLLEGQIIQKQDLRYALFGSKRKHIPWEIVSTNPSAAELDTFISTYGEALISETHPGIPYCATGMMFMHRDLWDECSAYDERLVHWGWMEIDLGMRITQKYPYIDVTQHFDMVIYHLEHYKSPTGERIVTRKSNPNNQPTEFRPNGNNWGFPLLNFENFSYSVASLDNISAIAQLSNLPAPIG